MKLELRSKETLLVIHKEIRNCSNKIAIMLAPIVARTGALILEVESAFLRKKLKTHP